MKYELTERVFIWPGEMASWYFVPITKKIGASIKQAVGMNTRGFGSIPVVATIKTTTWQTSIFPDKSSGSYLLPLKAKVRKAERVFADDLLTFTIEIR